MPDMKDLANVQLAVAFIVPGLIISYVRTRFIAGRLEKTSDALLAYLALTIVYYGLTVPFIAYIIEQSQGIYKTLLWWCLIAVGPAAARCWCTVWLVTPNCASVWTSPGS